MSPDRFVKQDTIGADRADREKCPICRQLLHLGDVVAVMVTGSTLSDAGHSYRTHYPVCPLLPKGSCVVVTSQDPTECSECGQEVTLTRYRLLGTMITMPRYPVCPDCRTALDAKRQAEEAAQEEAARIAEIAKTRREWRGAAGIPRKFLTQDFSTFDTSRPGNVKAVFDQCLEYADGFPIEYRTHTEETGEAYPSLMLFSTDVWGIGKTHLACAIAHRILDRWQGEEISRPVLFVSEPDIYQSIQATFNFSAEERRLRESEDDILRRLIYVPLLVLDDLGKQQRSDMKFVQRTLFAIINGRYDALRPMVVTSNMGQEQLAAYLGGGKADQATFDRLWEMTGGQLVRLTGESFRRR